MHIDPARCMWDLSTSDQINFWNICTRILCPGQFPSKFLMERILFLKTQSELMIQASWHHTLALGRTQPKFKHVWIGYVISICHLVSPFHKILIYHCSESSLNQKLRVPLEKLIMGPPIRVRKISIWLKTSQLSGVWIKLEKLSDEKLPAQVGLGIWRSQGI